MEIERSSVINYNKNKIEVKHLENLVNKLIDCYQIGKFCDVTLIAGVNKRRIPAHRLMLSAANPYFDAMFTNDLREKNEKEIVWNEIHGDELKMLIDFCYTGYIDLNQENVYGILATASRMEFIDVETKCSDFLRNELNPSNCLTVWAGIELFPNLKELTEKAVQLAEENFLEIIGIHEFLLLGSDHLFTLLSSDNLDVWCEEEVFNAVVAWVNYDEEARRDSVSKLMTAIRFTQIKPKFLYRNVKEFCEKFNCHDLIKDYGLWKAFPADQPNPCVPRKSTTLKWLMALGNYRPQDPEHRSTEVYSPLTNKWRSFNKITWERDGFSSIIANGELYILGGRNGNDESLNSVHKYNFATSELKEIAPMKVARHHFATAFLNNSIYAAGGVELNYVERLDLETGKWLEVAPMLEKRMLHKLVAFNGRLLAIGGRNENSKRLKSVEYYDPFENKWLLKTSMNLSRSSHAVAVHDNKIYVLGGAGEDKIAEYYHPLLDQWIMMPHVDIPLNGFGLIISSGNFIVAGGSIGTNNSQPHAYEFDLETFNQKPIAPLNYKRRHFSLLEIPSYGSND